MNKFEFKNLVKNLKDSLKQKSFFKDLRKEVETGANGTQDYVVKKGINDVDLELVWDPPWNKDMMSEAAKLELNL